MFKTMSVRFHEFSFKLIKAFRYYFFRFSCLKKVSLPGSQNVLHFGLKCSKSRRLLGLCPRPRWGAYDDPPDPLVVRGFLPSAIAASRLQRLILLELPQNKNSPPVSPPKHKIIEPSLTWPADPLNLAVHGSNEIACVSYWGFIPKLHFKFCLILLYIIEPSKLEHDCCIKYFQTVFQLQITKHIFKMYFKYFCQLLWTRGPKY